MNAFRNTVADAPSHPCGTVPVRDLGLKVATQGWG
jgi:hypothetical protein